MKRLVVLAMASGLGLTGLVAVPASAAPAAPVVHAGLNWGAKCSDGVLAAAEAFGVKIQCANLKVPLDYKRPKGKKITLALSRVLHTGDKKAYKGTLLVNPGGPGGSGTGFGARVAGQSSPALKAAYDFIGFDPRGVGDSVPALTCNNDYFKPVRPDYVFRNKKEEAAWLKKSKGYAQACGKKWGWILPHMKTTDAVRDMDSIRAALGQKKLNYYGASYGTALGSVYATLFPKRVGKFVLDSNIRPSGVWYDDNLDQDVAFDRNSNIFFAWIAKYDSKYHLGTTKAAVRKFYYDTRKKLHDTPALGVVGPDEYDDSFLLSGYRASSVVWGTLAAALSAYKAGNPAPLKDAYDNFGATTDDNGYAVYNAVQCSDAKWPRDWNKWRHDNTKLYKRAPFLTWGNAWYNAPCVFWPVKAGTFTKIKSAKGLPNILLFQATLDAATPFSGGTEMNRLLKGSRLVIEDGGLTHGIVHRGSTCIDSKFDAFLLGGALPANRTHCAKLPDPVPPAAASLAAKAGPSGIAGDIIVHP